MSRVGTIPVGARLSSNGRSVAGMDGMEVGLTSSDGHVVISGNAGSDDTGRIANDERMLRNIPRDDGARADDRIGANLDEWKHDGAGADERALPDGDLSGDDRARADRREWSERDVMADGGAAIHEDELCELSAGADRAPGAVGG
jgi:hypothetical protein